MNREDRRKVNIPIGEVSHWKWLKDKITAITATASFVSLIFVIVAWIINFGNAGMSQVEKDDLVGKVDNISKSLTIMNGKILEHLSPLNTQHISSADLRNNIDDRVDAKTMQLREDVNRIKLIMEIWAQQNNIKISERKADR